jgi:hypothetical protein
LKHDTQRFSDHSCAHVLFDGFEKPLYHKHVATRSWYGSRSLSAIVTWDLGLTTTCNVPSEAFAVGCGETLGAPRWPGLLTTRASGQVPSDQQLYLNASPLQHSNINCQHHLAGHAHHVAVLFADAHAAR